MATSRDPAAPQAPEVVWPSKARSPAEAEARAGYEVLVRAFHRGDFRAVRRGASTLDAPGVDEEVRLRTAALLSRLQPDALAIVVAVAAGILWAVSMLKAVG